MATKRPAANWADLRDGLWERSQGRCELSGRPLDRDTFDAHHRRNKGMGGTYRPDTDTLPNLLATDPQVHNGGPGSIHAHRPRSQACGWLISKTLPTPAALVPVLRWVGHGRWQWFVLTEAGRATWVPWDVSPELLALVQSQPWPRMRSRA